MTREPSMRCPWCGESCRYWGLETCPLRPRQIPRTPKKLQALLALMPGDSIMAFSDFIKQQGSETAAKSTLREALAAGIVEPVYTLCVQPVEPVPWTRDLMSLRRHFTGADGQAIDGADPSQIRVGFRRAQKTP